MQNDNSTIKQAGKRFFNSRLTFFDSLEDYEDKYKRRRAIRFSAKWWFLRFLNAIICFGLILLGLNLFGCARKIEYRDVYIPQKCLIEKINRPRASGDILKDTAKIFKYTELLEASIEKCR